MMLTKWFKVSICSGAVERVLQTSRSYPTIAKAAASGELPCDPAMAGTDKRALRPRRSKKMPAAARRRRLC